MHWKNKKFVGWKRKFAWFPTQILDNGTLKQIWLSWYERKWDPARKIYEERLTKLSFTADVSTFSSEWRYPLALFPVRVHGGYTVWLGRYAKRYTGRTTDGYPSGDPDYWDWEKLRYIDYVERIMTNGSDNRASKR